LRQRIEIALELGIRLLLDVQHGPSDAAPGAVPRARKLLPPTHPLYSESFNIRATEVRIDYPQHFLGAVLNYREHRFGRVTERQPVAD
jgi:hypothetical protein